MSAEETGQRSRRDFLKTTGAAATAGLAGCNGDPDPTDGDDSEPEDDYTDSDDEIDDTPDYELQLADNQLSYDLTELGFGLENYTEEDVRENYTAELTFQLLENGEEVEDLSQINTMLENKEGEQIEHTTEENTVKIPEYAVKQQLYETEDHFSYDGSEGIGLHLLDNTLTLKVETGEETVTADNIEVDKQTPERIKADMKKDGENLHELGLRGFENYSTPFQFDTVNRDTETYQTLMQQQINADAMQDVVQTAIDEEKHNFNPDMNTWSTGFGYSFRDKFDEDEPQKFLTEQFRQHKPDDIEKIMKDGVIPAFKEFVSMGGSNYSGQSGAMVGTAAKLADVHINGLDMDENRFEHDLDIDMRTGFTNSIGDTSHGNGIVYFKNRGEWRNLDVPGEIGKIENAPNVTDNGMFHAGGNYKLGEVSNVAYHTKKQQALNMLGHIFNIPINNPDIKGGGSDDNWLNKATDRPENNERIRDDEEEMLKQMMWAAATTDKDYSQIYGGDINENRLLLTDDRDERETFRYDPSPVTTQQVE